MTPNTFAVGREHIRRTRVLNDGAETAVLGEGQVRVRIDVFALTANNVTYAVLGDAMGYWNFFSGGLEGGEGRIPVWGFADLVESANHEVGVGERFYGFYPVSSHAVLDAARVTPGGFVDGAEHRKPLPGIYNQYTRCSTDPGYAKDREAEIALFRPLFGTGFLLDDFFADSAFFGARTVVIGSASSKTAYATAFCLSERRGTPESVRVIGLTSPENLAFTRRLGCYDEAVPYAALETLPKDRAVYIDIHGSPALRARVHAHFGDHLAYSCLVGGSHWQERGRGEQVSGPEPKLFFAPSWAKKRREDLGGPALGERLAARLGAFSKRVMDPGAPWLTVVRGRGLDAVLHTYRALLDGSVPAPEGHVLSLSNG